MEIVHVDRVDDNDISGLEDLGRQDGADDNNAVNNRDQVIDDSMDNVLKPI